MSENFFCNKCGAQNTAGAQFCSRCGAPTNLAPGSPAAAQGPFNPMPSSAVSASSYAPVAQAVGYGGFWIRVLAALIDGVIVRLAAVPVVLIFGGLGMARMTIGLPRGGLGILGGGVTVMVILFGGWLYEALMESSSYQATLGKMILGMKVTDLYGNRISFGRATGRHFAKILSGMVLCIGFIMVGLTQRKQGLHDLLAGTLVRRG
jgi:uncharacterized RDD family membrane protein YckC/ribosomal protein L40E